MSVSVEFQNRIKDLFNEKELKRSNLASEMGIDYRSFSNAINYGIIPKPIILIRIADYFEISIDYLLAMSDDEYFSKSKNPSDFHARLENLREEKGITFYQISQESHIDKSYFSKWIKKKHLPSLELLILLAEYFEVSIDYLLGRTDDR